MARPRPRKAAVSYIIAVAATGMAGAAVLSGGRDLMVIVVTGLAVLVLVTVVYVVTDHLVRRDMEGWRSRRPRR